MRILRKALRSLRARVLVLVLAAVVTTAALSVVFLVASLDDHIAATYWVLLSVILGGLVLYVLLRLLGGGLPGPIVLELDLSEIPAEKAPTSPLEMLRGRSLTMLQTVQTLHRAAHDKRVVGLVVYPRFGRAGLAQLQELRDAISAFGREGKPTLAFAASFTGNAEYYLASACDEVVLQPLGEVGLTGLGVEATFVRGALDKAGVVWAGDKRREYKSAADRFTETSLRGPSKEQLERLLESQFDQIVAAVADARKLPADAVRSLIDHAPFLDVEAVSAGLVDRLAYRDEIVEQAKLRGGKHADLLWLDRYRRAAGPGRVKTKRTVALIAATGGIVDRPGLPMFADRVIVGDDLAKQIRKAAKDDRVDAIVLRVDSPGGAVGASETVRRALVHARDGGKPVVISMGNVAASGGYWIATGADRVVAQPGTITGSIGVLTGKPVLAGLKGKVGVSVDPLATSANALMYSPNRPFDEAGWERVQATLDSIYDAFVSRVAQARSLSVERVHEIARGRVWTGADAKDLGLVDELGGLQLALRLAGEIAGGPRHGVVRVKDMGHKSLLSQVRSKPEKNSEDLLARVVALLAPYAGLVVDQGALHAGVDLEEWTIR